MKLMKYTVSPHTTNDFNLNDRSLEKHLRLFGNFQKLLDFFLVAVLVPLERNIVDMLTRMKKAWLASAKGFGVGDS